MPAKRAVRQRGWRGGRVRHGVRRAGDAGGRLRQTGYALCSRRSFVLAGLAAVCSQRGDLTEGRGCPGSSMMIR